MKLPIVLRLNAASCLAFGVLFLIGSPAVAQFLGSAPEIAPTVIRVLGAVLIINGLHLLWAAAQALPAKALIAWFTAGDIAWTLGTTALVFYGGWVSSGAGIVLTLAVAVFVGALGVAQFVIRSSMAAQA